MQHYSEKSLKEVGLRVTAARVKVLDHLYSSGCPLSQHMLADCPDLREFDRVTVYRTLNRLKETGLVHAVQGTDGAWRYCAHPPDRAGCPGNHPHFLCLECGRMFCLTGQKLPWVEVPAGVEVQGKQLVVYGRCAECRASGQTEDREDSP
jgi:Fur family ferric uptake transcriptional regulator